MRRNPESLPGLKKDLLSAWVLLLLDGNPRHGYDIRSDLRSRGYEPDPSVLYRTLNAMEAEGLIGSHWAKPVAGPRRRVYKVTAKGRKRLQENAEAITRSRAAQNAFLKAYKTAQRLDR